MFANYPIIIPSSHAHSCEPQWIILWHTEQQETTGEIQESEANMPNIGHATAAADLFMVL